MAVTVNTQHNAAGAGYPRTCPSGLAFAVRCLRSANPTHSSYARKPQLSGAEYRATRKERRDDAGQMPLLRTPPSNDLLVGGNG